MDDDLIDELREWQREACAELVEAGRYVFDVKAVRNLLERAYYPIPDWMN